VQESRPQQQVAAQRDPERGDGHLDASFTIRLDGEIGAQARSNASDRRLMELGPPQGSGARRDSWRAEIFRRGPVALALGCSATCSDPCSADFRVFSSRCPGLNRGPTVYETVALPLSYSGLFGAITPTRRKGMLQVRAARKENGGGDNRPGAEVSAGSIVTVVVGCPRLGCQDWWWGCQ
jgi:hypothetical protein